MTYLQSQVQNFSENYLDLQEIKHKKKKIEKPNIHMLAS